MPVLHLGSKDFEAEVLRSGIPVLVDFWAEWCGPCKMIGPIIDEIASDFKGRLKVGKVNVDEAQDLAGNYSVMSIPTLLFFKKGKIVEQVVGVMSKEQLVEKIESII
ncbi:MAG: thioredoxin [Omnitrophica WOR_2 bacterium RIFOXYB2_FULL_38_16]|nr:MAG: thioredoxin [Omnitrophica WOR_2 bacterium RIFOXYA12_FULL_38_10]OGX55709.1 MAG: thioredoxin [Omnitrophica WOR_2 bacterium RIFOXYC2_FULL_38_12]OGX58929.1 MAG: thioredoxin [Omnitrophica WOR_2 bacterium RIFOXYB2_FULL_38_16]HBG61479.1 thioredoxin [Candidatus Omnitrophota bacterium]